MVWANIMKDVGSLDYDPVFYFSIEEVQRQFVTHSNTRSNCYLKGEAIYWSLELGQLKLPDVAWKYLQPAPGMEN
ncbi:MAG: DUF427 domain-containing protein [Pseudomonadales bacterium]|nr:DUF427 domain-containing protein [Pseudomonadales bacterium]